MKLTAATVFVYALIVLCGGVLGFSTSGGWISLVSAAVCAVGLIATGVGTLRGSVPFSYAAGVLTFLLAIYFAYRFIASERFIPTGVLLIVSFFALFLIMVGVFIDLSRQTRVK